MSHRTMTAIAASLLCAAPISLHWSPTQAPQFSVDGAQARIGRPLTPFSVAGVNRRMTDAHIMAVTVVITVAIIARTMVMPQASAQLPSVQRPSVPARHTTTITPTLRTTILTASITTPVTATATMTTTGAIGTATTTKTIGTPFSEVWAVSNLLLSAVEEHQSSRWSKRPSCAGQVTVREGSMTKGRGRCQPTAQGELQKAVPDQIRLGDVLCGGARLRGRRRVHLAKFSGSGGKEAAYGLGIALPFECTSK